MWRRAASRDLPLDRRLVWMVGSPRTGSTWLAWLLADLIDAVTFDEPLIGMHLGLLLPDVLGSPAGSFEPDRLRVADSRRGDRDYFFNDRYRGAWQPALRDLVLARFAAELDDLGDDGGRWVVVKEPNGSAAIDLLLDALPAARLLYLTRDGRDVVDSQLDAAQPGAWLDRYGGGRPMTGDDRLAYLEERAHRWVVNQHVVGRVYDGLPDQRRLLVRYEDLRRDPAGQLGRCLDWLDTRPRQDLAAVVDKHSFERIQERGAGRFARAAQPGLWRQSLTADEQQMLARVMGPTLERLGYEP